MKKVLTILSAFALAFAVAACEEEVEEREGIAMITDYGDIDDESFNQGTWEGIVEYAEENDIPHEYYRPSEVSDAEYINSIDMAVNDGFEIIVTPGFLFERAIHESQYNHPDVKFIILDGEPRDEDGETDIADNTNAIYYDEHESGFLAGYGAVKEGLHDLGYMGGMAVPAVVRFGVGFIAGAYYAADELDVEIDFADNRYTYLDSFDPSDEFEAQAAGWYEDGIDVIFAAAGGAGTSVMSAAGDHDAWMIGVDVDQSAESETVLTSAKKALAESVQFVLDQHYEDDEFPGGEINYLSATEDGVALPTDEEAWRFEEFTMEEYNDVFDQLADGTIDVPSTYSELEGFLSDLGIEEIDIEEETVEP